MLTTLCRHLLVIVYRIMVCILETEQIGAVFTDADDVPEQTGRDF